MEETILKINEIIESPFFQNKISRINAGVERSTFSIMALERLMIARDLLELEQKNQKGLNINE